MQFSRVAVLGLGGVLAAVGLITLATGDPSDYAGYMALRVCVDADDQQVNYLDGGELVGETFDAADFGLGEADSIILSGGDETDYHYFFNLSAAGQLSVSEAGASGLGLDADRVYPLRVTATDEGTLVESASIDVGVWLDTSTLSPGDDGQCS